MQGYMVPPMAGQQGGMPPQGMQQQGMMPPPQYMPHPGMPQQHMMPPPQQMQHMPPPQMQPQSGNWKDQLNLPARDERYRTEVRALSGVF